MHRRIDSSDAASTDASSPTTPTNTPPPTATWPLLESRRERWGAPAPDAVVVAQAVGRSEAVRKNVREAADLAILWGMVVVVVGLTGLDEEDFWPGCGVGRGHRRDYHGCGVRCADRGLARDDPGRGAPSRDRERGGVVVAQKSHPRRDRFRRDHVGRFGLRRRSETPEGPSLRADTLRDPCGSAPRGSPRNRPAARRPWPRPHHPERRHPNPPPPRRVQLADILNRELPVFRSLHQHGGVVPHRDGASVALGDCGAGERSLLVVRRGRFTSKR